MNRLKMSGGLISVIIPVYNVENYIGRCLDSIVSQTYTNLEIVLVDDGATDSSGVICENYAKQDNRIRVIHKENGGLSSARNAGLKVANGDYIAFVDSDDFIHPMMYEIMLKTLGETESDMVVSEIGLINEIDIVEFEFPRNEKLASGYVCLEGNAIWQKLFAGDDIVTVVQWNKLFKSSVMRGVEYPEGRVHEDVYVIHRELYNCSRVTYLDAVLYYYVQRSDSIMHTETRKMIRDAIDGYCDRIDFMKEKNLRWEYNCSVLTLMLYLHWKFVTVSNAEGYSNTSKWIGKVFQEYAKRYKEIISDYKEYRILSKNPRKYCRYLKYENRKKSLKNCLLKILKYLKRHELIGLV